MNGIPNGLGKWKGLYNQIVEGEWKDGQLNGKAILNWDGGYSEYEVK